MDLIKIGNAEGTIVSLESKLWTDSLFVKNDVLFETNFTMVI